MEAFQTNENTAPQKPERHFATTVQMNGSAGGNVSQIQDAKITRDVVSCHTKVYLIQV